MAIGMDRSLPASSRPALRSPPRSAAPAGAAPSYGSRPPAISDRATQALANNMAVSSYGAGQMARKDLDRAGVSRGKGHAYYADVAQAQADVQAGGQAAGAEMEAAAANARAQADYANTMRSEQAANAGLLESLRSNATAERLAKRGFQQDIYEAMARGQLGLDSMNLDTTSLLDKLLRG